MSYTTRHQTLAGISPLDLEAERRHDTACRIEDLEAELAEARSEAAMWRSIAVLSAKRDDERRVLEAASTPPLTFWGRIAAALGGR